MISTQPFAKTLCSICFEDLKPIVEDLQAISICGHVFHELCLQQWFEYCSKGKKKCPICKQTCSACNVSRLYFKSVGDLGDINLSQKLQTHNEDPEELKLEARRLEEEISELGLALKSRELELKNLNDELSVCKKQLKKEASLKKDAMDEKDRIRSSLNLKIQELDESRRKRSELEEKNKGLNKELSALKLAFNIHLENEEKDKQAPLCTDSNSKESVDALKKLLVTYNKLYKELYAKYKTLERDDAHSHKELEKANEKLNDLKKLTENVKSMETAKEMKDNYMSSASKASNKTKDLPSVLIVDLTLDDTSTPQDTIKEHGVHLRIPKRQRVNENIIRSNNKNGDDPTEVSVSPESPSYASVPQPTKRAITDDDVASVWEIRQDKPLFNITNKVSLPDPSSQVAESWCSAGLLDQNGTKRHLGKWCKKGQNKGSNAFSIPT